MSPSQKQRLFDEVYSNYNASLGISRDDVLECISDVETLKAEGSFCQISMLILQLIFVKEFLHQGTLPTCCTHVQPKLLLLLCFTG